MFDLDVSKIIIQIIGFLAMLWIMKKYGWKPLLDVLEARQTKIREEFESIEAQKREASLLALQYEERLKGFEADNRRKIQEAVEEGHRISSEIQEEAQNRAKEVMKKAKSEVDSEIAKAKNKLKDDMVNLVVNVTNRIIKEDLDVAAQKKLIADFVEEAQLK